MTPGERQDVRPRTHCVVYHRRGTPPPAALSDALHNRGVEPAAVDDPYRALAMLCEVSRSSSARPCVLLLVEPRGLARASMLVSCAERYAPRCACWVYTAGEGQALRAVMPEDLEAAPVKSDRGLDGDRVAGTAPTLRLAETDPPEEPAAPRSSAPAREPEPEAAQEEDGDLEPASLLTDEELAMLLADPDEPGGRQSGVRR